MMKAKSKKRLILLICISLMAGAVAGCGGIHPKSLLVPAASDAVVDEVSQDESVASVSTTDIAMSRDFGWLIDRIFKTNGEKSGSNIAERNSLNDGFDEDGERSEIVELMIKRAKERSGAPEAYVSWNDDHTITIHLYENVKEKNGGSHTATWDWYIIDVDTMKGEDFFGNPVDLSE